MRKKLFVILSLMVMLTLNACQLQMAFQAWMATETPTPTLTFTPTATATFTPTPTVTLTFTPTVTFTATATNTPFPTKTRAPVFSATPGSSEGCNGSNSSFEQQVVSQINQERANAGLGALSTNNSLSSAARGHSQDMATSNYFGHTGSDGSDLASRLSAVGYVYTAAAENIYAGEGTYNTPYSAVSSWMGSEGHRANILSSAFTEVGVGYWCNSESKYKGYFTADFGSR
jgi:uncharacterized protein YkwD